jgi:transcriptional regulator with XRE-family HTH domain
MKLNLAENLKKLRKGRGITQEELANFIGVSFQAISKWERDEGYPDITLLPSIANFFNVTLDELLGMNEIQNQEKRESILREANKFISEGMLADCVSVLRDGLRIFPNDYHIMYNLALYLDGYGKTSEERRKNRNESITLCERILEFSTDTKMRLKAQSKMCFSLWRNGEKERAINMAKELPTMDETVETTLPKFLSGEEKAGFCQSTIQGLTWHFWWLIGCMIDGDYYTDEEQIELLKKAIAFYEIVYEKEDYAVAHLRIGDAYEDIAIRLLEQGKIDEGLKALEKCVDHCISFDTLPDTKKFESLLVNLLEYRKSQTATSTPKNSCRHVLDDILRDLKKEDGIFHLCEQNISFKKIIERLEAIAN